MGRFLYVALSDALPGREPELDRWYDELHIGQVLDVPGFVSARRFAAVEAGDGPPRRRKILMIYEIEAEDPAAVIAALRERRGTDQLIPSDALDPQSMFAQVYRPLGETIYPARDDKRLDRN
ncbi:MAG TPA: hypothetical protein VL918_05765 [Sphingobium sp.]|nr:hypothetical protein [Sphingobium sp.]